ncbi:hypothetical protein [Pyrococcus sp. NA2]|uniref:hypothetical protein n=1 Tax=Pyrococcus sp. (strain NA2) TaxID=342949 RepID=UPI00064EC5DC|nr:hypothetical protein [Pyrococcus sp. NA2]
MEGTFLTKKCVFLLMIGLAWIFNALLFLDLVGVINFQRALLYPFPVLGTFLALLYNRASPPALDKNIEFKIATIPVVTGMILLAVGLYIHA